VSRYNIRMQRRQLLHNSVGVYASGQTFNGFRVYVLQPRHFWLKLTVYPFVTSKVQLQSIRYLYLHDFKEMSICKRLQNLNWYHVRMIGMNTYKVTYTSIAVRTSPRYALRLFRQIILSDVIHLRTLIEMVDSARTSYRVH